MAQGTRGRWRRVAATGFGLVLCTGLVGCMNDKPRDLKTGTKQPGPGLPGTPRLDGTGATAKNGTPSPYGTPGSGIQQAGGIQPGGAGPTRFGTNGLNTNTGTVGQPNFNSPPGAPGMINAPAQPGAPPSVLPGGVGVTNPGSPGTATAYSPPAPPLTDMPQPPAPPALGHGGAPDLAAMPLAPPITPPVPPPGSGLPVGKGTP